MEDIKDIKDAFENLEHAAKLSFIDGLTDLFEQKEIEWGETYDNADVEEKFKLLRGSAELRQLIYALKEQKRNTRRYPYDKANKVWAALVEYFEATES